MSTMYRHHRGGYYASSPEIQRHAGQNYSSPTYRWPNLGIRLVRVVPEPQENKMTMNTDTTTDTTTNIDADANAGQNPFVFQVPAWVNRKMGDLSAADVLARAQALASSYYPLATQTGIHSMIEWCGVMGEYVNMLGDAHKYHGIDPRSVDQHSGEAVPAQPFQIEYICEKLGCQLKPFIRANKDVWRRAINRWFEDK